MGPLEIRTAVVGDAEAMQGVFRRASLSNDGDRVALLAHPEALRLSEGLAASGRARVATLADGTVVGFASTTSSRPGTLELEDLFVEPTWMRRGVARALVHRVGAEALTAGVTRLEVTANQHALDFYLAVGFVVDGSADTEFGAGVRMHLDTAVG